MGVSPLRIIVETSCTVSWLVAADQLVFDASGKRVQNNSQTAISGEADSSATLIPCGCGGTECSASCPANTAVKDLTNRGTSVYYRLKP
jgi:hypothetical protein